MKFIIICDDKSSRFRTDFHNIENMNMVQFTSRCDCTEKLSHRMPLSWLYSLGDMGFIHEVRSDIERVAVRLLREYRAVLFREALRLCNDEQTAEDLVMRTIETFLAKSKSRRIASCLAAALQTTSWASTTPWPISSSTTLAAKHAVPKYFKPARTSSPGSRALSSSYTKPRHIALCADCARREVAIMV